jgi:uncharacterized protein YjiK
MKALALLAAGITGGLAAGCGGGQTLEQELARRQQRFDAHAAEVTREPAAPLARWVLPVPLAEISGLTLTADGRLLSHDDEQGRITVIDPKRGVVLKQFQLDGRNVRADFEGITTVDSTIIMVTSQGVLYSFGEGTNDGKVPFTTFDTKLGKACEFEGVVFDSTGRQLLLPCKRAEEKDLRDQLVIYKVRLPLSAASTPEVMIIPLDRIAAVTQGKALHPTDITRDPLTGNFVLVAAPERALIELSPTFDLVRAMALPRTHAQAEGVAVTTDGILIVSDEAQASPATITLYRWPMAGLTAA